jgi:hypothetical protein
VQDTQQGADQTSQEIAGFRSSIISLTTGERNSVSQIMGINAQFTFLDHLQNEVQANAGSSSLPLPCSSGFPMIRGKPIAYYVLQMRKESDVFSSRIKSESMTIGGVTFESYYDTMQWVTAHCHKDEWKYVMDMHALYTLVKTGGQGYKSLLEEQSNSTEAGYASAKKARLSLSFQCNIPKVFGPGKYNKTDYHFGDVATYEK